ncbi:alpha/beta hydrolase [Thermoleophilia bacterium SCSIO 60948]|nr:alpha/beta hydrolase [Thermoleophilia bacterium SCSIO 60948]
MASRGNAATRAGGTGANSMREGEIDYRGRKMGYTQWGEGERTIVLTHGLLMNRRMYDRLGPALAEQGYRVIALDMLGHGRSERPDDMRLYSIPAFSHQVETAIEALEIDRPVVGGTSLGANIALDLAVRRPDIARGLFIEMPVLDNALVGAVLVFSPVLLGLKFGRPLLHAVSALTSRIPRTTLVADIALDWVRQTPEASSAVMEGVLFERTAPPHHDRVNIELPTLIIGHPADPLHPFSDSDMLFEELPNGRLVEATSFAEWRLSPTRLNTELASFLDEVYGPTSAAASRNGASETLKAVR